jgi:hypothetical protein
MRPEVFEACTDRKRSKMARKPSFQKQHMQFITNAEISSFSSGDTFGGPLPPQ